MPLTLEQLDRLRRIFAQKQWPLFESPDSPEYDFSSMEDQNLFTNFSTILNKLSPVEIDLILTLTEDFDKIRLEAMSIHFQRLIKQIPGPILESIEEVYVFPIVHVDDKNEVKSGHFISYNITHSYLKPLLKNLKNRIKQYNSVDSLKHHFHRKNALIVGVDDFVGSAETANSFIDRYQAKRQGNQTDTLILLAVAAMDDAVQAIRARKVHIYASLVKTKGIGQSAKITDKPFAYKVMDLIESALKFESNCNYGYLKSEALISLVRTPDNTFPVYWADEHSDGTGRSAPFPR